MRGAALALGLGFAVAMPQAGGADACKAGSGGDPGRELTSPRYAVSYRTQPEQIEVGRHFSVDLVVCPRGEAASPPESVAVDAHMPEHRHGMNYKAVVTAQGGGRYRAEGLLFHMPGRWELVFEMRGEGRTDRVTRSVELE